MMNNELHIDMAFRQMCKRGENVCGDVFKFVKIPEEDRVIGALSDGLGSGVKANILASMTAVMAAKFAAANKEPEASAEIIMSALPVCKVRKISYSTFTIVDADTNGRTKIVEMGNPPFLLVRNRRRVATKCETVASEKWRDRSLRVYDLQAEDGDRIILASDGVTQAGMGGEKFKLGWRVEGCMARISELLEEDEGVPSHRLAERVLQEAVAKEPGFLPHDDMTCAVIHFRTPRKMLLFTGPPFSKDMDARCAEMARDFKGTKVICGGTTAEIVARELGRELRMNLRDGGDLPPTSRMEGMELVTEGIFTLTKAAGILDRGFFAGEDNPAGRLADLLLAHDIIEILAGTRINEAHQDPNLPVDLEIRRNIVKRIAGTLEEKYLKEVTIKFV